MPDGLYPFATQDGKAIPLDIINPKGFLHISFDQLAITNFTIGANWEVATFFSTKNALIGFAQDLPAPLIEGTEYINALFLPANVVVTSAVIPGTASILSLDINGRLFVQRIDKWAGLGLATQYVRK